MQARNQDLEDAGTLQVDQLVGTASVDDYDALLLPGGTVDPDELRMKAVAVKAEHLGRQVMSLDDGPRGYNMFRRKEDGCVRTVFRPA